MTPPPTTTAVADASSSSSSSSSSWGDWMGAWKVVGDGQNNNNNQIIDQEAERIDRQKAAFGGDTVARIKDLNILIIGCQGVGVETAKNIILSNVGSVTLYDPDIVRHADLGTNFYLHEHHVGNNNSRANASLSSLKTLNPYCKVECTDSISDEYLLSNNILGTEKPFSVIVVTTLLPKSELLRLNTVTRNHNMAFILAFTTGVTSCLFSDFGLQHEITDANGEPTQMLAISNIEIIHKKPKLLQVSGIDDEESTIVVVTVAQTEHGLDDGDVVVLDDMRGDMSILNQQQYEIRRMALLSPTDAKVDATDVTFREALKQPTKQVIDNFQRQYDHYQQTFESDNNNKDKKKFPVRTITMFNRLVLVLPEGVDNSVTPQTFANYEAGGLMHQIRPTIVKSYRSFQETLECTTVPQMLRGEDWEAGKGIDVHLSIAAALDFYDQIGHWPRLHNTADADQLYEIAKNISGKRQKTQGDNSCWAQKVEFGFPSGQARDLDEVRIKRFARLFETELTGFCAFLGGAVAQEVLKKTGKFTPIEQWIHHDEHVLVNDECPSNIGPLFGSRYDHQIAVLGKDFQARVGNQRVFLVGCGALGCEYLKGLCLMGAGTGRDGQIYVTDMDRIEVSNLSRQFLFRDSDVGSPKSVSGARVVKEWNPQMNIKALEKKVGEDTEDFFDDNFWESLDLCWNALDNVAARKYTDTRCLFFAKPLLESGTLGTKCNHEVILPYRTSTYNDGKESDDNENQIAMCTLRSFPYLPLHAIEYAKQAYFSDYFCFAPDQYETFRKDKESFFEQLDTMEAGEQLKSLKMIDFFVHLQETAGGKIDFSACIKIAFDRMVEDFRISILNLCHAADQMEKSSGKKFWTGTKRRPRAVEWTVDPVPTLMEYLYCTANLYAVVWGLDPVRDRGEFENLVAGLELKQPQWSPSVENVDLTEEEESNAGGVDEAAEAEKLKARLYSLDVSSLQKAVAHDFEKDDDSNFHVDFLTIATNLRSWNYDIKQSQRHTVKVTAGRIIPALATTTAMVCGLVSHEFCKLVMGLQSMGREKFLNSNINLAAGSSNFTTYCPEPPIQLPTGLKAPHPEQFSSWDKIEIVNATSELSVEDLVGYIEKTFAVAVDRIFAYGNTEDKAIYAAVDKLKLDWDIVYDENGKPEVTDGVYKMWPQIRMAVQMLSRPQTSSAQRKIFENQVGNVKRALDKVKEGFETTYHGPISAAYRTVYEPADEKEQEYFETVFEGSYYIKLGIHCHSSDGEDIHLPCIKYVYKAASMK